MATNDRGYHPILVGPAPGQPLQVAATAPVAQAAIAGVPAPAVVQRRINQNRFAFILYSPAPAGALLGAGPGPLLTAVRDHVMTMWRPSE